MRVLAVEHEADYLSARRFNDCIAEVSDDVEVLVHVEDAFVRPDFIWQHVKWHVLATESLVSGAMFEGDHETWDPAACERGRLFDATGQPVECDYRQFGRRA